MGQRKSIPAKIVKAAEMPVEAYAARVAPSWRTSSLTLTHNGGTTGPRLIEVVATGGNNLSSVIVTHETVLGGTIKATVLIGLSSGAETMSFNEPEDREIPAGTYYHSMTADCDNDGDMATSRVTYFGY